MLQFVYKLFREDGISEQETAWNIAKLLFTFDVQ